MYALLAVAAAFAATPQESVRAAVAARLRVPPADVEVAPLEDIVGLPTSGCAVELPRVGAVEGSVPVVLLCGSGRWSTRVYVDVWRVVPVAAEAAERGETVTIATERRSTRELRGDPLIEGEGPWRARVAMQAGEPLTTTRVAPVPDAARGAAVILEAGGDRFMVRASGELLVDAWVDQSVTVLNLSTRTVVAGVYRGDGRVTVESR